MSHSLVHALVAHNVCDVLFGRYAQAIDVMATTILEEFQGISSTVGTCRVAKRSYKQTHKHQCQPIWTLLLEELDNKRLFQNGASRKLVGNASCVQPFVGATSHLENLWLFLHRCVHAAFVNTKWYEKWSERTLFVDPIINDVQGLCVLTRTQGQLLNCHDTRHTATGQDTLVVPCLRWSSLITS